MIKNNSEKRVYLVEYSDKNDSDLVFAYSVSDLISKLKNRKWDSFLDVTEEYANSK